MEGSRKRSGSPRTARGWPSPASRHLRLRRAVVSSRGRCLWCLAAPGASPPPRSSSWLAPRHGQQNPGPAQHDSLRGVSGDADLKRVAFAGATRSAATPQKISATVERVVAAREIRKTLEMLAAAGSEARYVTADVRDAAALVRILEGIRREWGPIRGLVHGAGVLSDVLLGKKTDAQFDRVFDTKVLGLRGLLDATREDPIAWMCLFSSVAARSGNAGQADYAMANEVLNKVAAAEARRRGDACRVVSIGASRLWAGGPGRAAWSPRPCTSTSSRAA